MTRSNPLQTKEATQGQASTWLAFWGTIIQASLQILVYVGVTILALSGYGEATVAAQTGTAISLLTLVVTLTLAAINVASIVLTLRKRQELGYGLTYFSLVAFVLGAILIVQGRAVFLSSFLLLPAALGIGWICPPRSRRFYIISTISAFALALAIEWVNPPWRVAYEGTQVGLTAAIVFAIIFIAVMVRQAWSLITFSISNRLTALVLVVTVPLLIGVTAYISNRAGNEIEAEELHNLQQNNQSLATNVSIWLELHVRSLHEMAMLPDITSMDAERQKPVLLAIAKTHPNLFLVHTVELNGMNLARNDDSEPVDYHDRAWFLGAQQGSPITYEALISRTIGKPALNMSTPIYNGSGKIVGVASIVSELSEISKEVLGSEQGHITYIVDEKNRVIAHPDPSYTEGELRDLSAYPPVAALNEGKTGQLTFTDENGVAWIAYVDKLNNGWGIVAQQTEAELLAPVRRFQTVSVILILIGSGVMFALAWFAIRRSLQPIGALTSTASAIAAGDLSRVAEVKSKDEVGALASTFNEMTARLRDLIGTLEQRVAERTAKMERRNLDLALAAEVGQTVSQVRELNDMLKDAAEIIRAFFGLYYVQIYLVNESQTELNLQFGTGAVGAELMSRKHRLPLNAESINGRAAVTKRSVVIGDTSTSSTFRPNPLLPNTRSEVAVPLLVGDTLVGVLDAQSERIGQLGEEALLAFEPMAGQMAVAIQNTRLVFETQKARAEIEALVRRLTHESWGDYLDAIHKPEKSGFVFEHDRILPLTGQEKLSEDALIAPIEITGETLGSLVVELVGTPPNRANELINTVARQVSQHIESLRLLDSAERFRYEAEQASRRLTHEGWERYRETAQNLGYVYNLNEVLPCSEEETRQIREAALNLPLKVQQETIGKLVIQGVEDEESISLANTVAERLSAHIEGLRLSMQTEQALAATKKQAQREQALRQITSSVRGSTDPTIILRTAARELGNLLGRKTVVHLATAEKDSAVTNEPVSPVESLNTDGGEK